MAIAKIQPVPNSGMVFVTSNDIKINKTLLIICNDVMGKKMAGPAIRSIHIADSLSNIMSVMIVAPRVYDDLKYPFKVLEANNAILSDLVSQADYILVQGDALVRYPFLKEIDAVLIADLYCPIPLEYHQVSDHVERSIRLDMGAHLANVVAEQLVYADLFLCASERQKDFWFGALTLAGRVNGLRWEKANRACIDDLIVTLPFGMSDQDPVLDSGRNRVLRDIFNIPSEHFVAVWGGGVYEWFDPLTVIRAIHQLNQENLPIHLVFMGVKHPNPGIVEHGMCRQAVELARELGILDCYVHFNFGWVEYDKRHEYFLDADVGVSAHFDTPETRYSFRTRMLDYFWCNLPIIASRGDFFGDAVHAHGLGVTVDFENVDAWVNAFRLLYLDRQYYQQCVINIQSYKENYRWSHVTRALSEQLLALEVAVDRNYVRQAFNRETKKPSLLMRLKSVHANGGVWLVFKLGVRRVYFSVFKD